MSWNAYLEMWGETRDWNYTHNCNGMANAVLDAGYEQRDVFSEVMGNKDTWWAQLDGMEALESAKFLDTIIKGLESDPEKFIAMQPDNNWGSYDSFLKILKEMRSAIPDEAPAKWTVHG